MAVCKRVLEKGDYRLVTTGLKASPYEWRKDKGPRPNILRREIQGSDEMKIDRNTDRRTKLES